MVPASRSQGWSWGPGTRRKVGWLERDSSAATSASLEVFHVSRVLVRTRSGTGGLFASFSAYRGAAQVPIAVWRPAHEPKTCGKRTSIQLQETAMVVEGELVQFHLLSLERYFARAVSEWSMITIPYSRLTRVKYRSKWVMRAFVWVILAVIFGMIGEALRRRAGRRGSPDQPFLPTAGGPDARRQR